MLTDFSDNHVFSWFLSQVFSFSVPFAGGNQTIQLPVDSMVLDGNVKDDGQIVSYLWTQIR